MRFGRNHLDESSMSLGFQEKLWFSSWPKDVPKSIDYPEVSMGQMLRKTAEKFPENSALNYSKQKITYRELDVLTARFAEAIRDRGVEKGDRVAIYLPNFPEFVVAYYGALKTGAIAVAISPAYKERELLHILTDSDARVIVCWDKLLQFVNAVKEKRKIDHIITAAGRASLFQRPTGSSEVVQRETENMNMLLADYDGISGLAEIQPKNDLALLQYTGGTTGVPKGAMLTHYNLAVNAFQFSTWLGMKTGEIHLAALPLFHIYGMTAAMNAPICTAGSIVLIPDARDTNAIIQAIDDFKPTVFCGVPALYVALINQPDINEHKLHSIRVCVSGASPLPQQVQRKFEELTGGRLVEGYGMTETSPVTHVNPLDNREKNRPGSIGIPISDTDARIVDSDNEERALPVGAVGELLIRGPQVMIGYWRNIQETKTVLRDGWFYSGDIASEDKDGYFRIVDRKKDMINVSGLKVWPREVEELLNEHHAIRETAVVGTPDPTSGEAVKAFVVLKDEFRDKVSVSEIISFCKERIANYKAPKVILFQDELPKSSVGKILRRELREQSR
jgi:long-chain acyl-CoA synthetase